MPDELTRVDREALERYCQTYPACRLFLENFFLSCEPYLYEANLANYQLDLQLYRSRSYVRQHRLALERAFFDIARRGE